MVFGQCLNSYLHLFLLYVSVFLSLGPSWETLPWQLSFQEVKENVANGLEAVSSGLLVSNVSVQRRVSRRTSQVLPVLERNMLSVAGLIALRQAEVNNVDGVLGGLGASSHEVVRLNVSVNYSFFVNYLNSLEHLDCDVKNSRQVKFSSALLEKVF